MGFGRLANSIICDFSSIQVLGCAEATALVSQVITELTEQFLQASIPHPDQNSTLHHRSYCPKDPIDEAQNERDCQERAEKRAKELLVRKFAIPYARRSSLEAYSLLACHIQLKVDDEIVQSTAKLFKVSPEEAQIFLFSLADIIRRSSIVSIQGASSYFPETGGTDNRPSMIEAGRSKRFIYLEKSDEDKKDKDSLSFMPGSNPKIKNRIGWYPKSLSE